MQTFLVLLRRYLAAAWRFRWLALAASWLVCVIGWTGVSIIPTQFEARARMYVNKDAVLTPILRGLAIDNSTATDVDVLRRTLLSRPNLEKLYQTIDQEPVSTSPETHELALKSLAAQIRVVTETGNLFTVEYRHRDRMRAYKVVKSLIDIFIEEVSGGNRAAMDNARQFIEQEIASYERQLRQAEKRRADFRAKYIDVIASADGGSRVELARASLRNLRGGLQDAISKRDGLSKELQSMPPTFVDRELGPSGAPVASRLSEAEQNLRELRLRFTEQHPDVIAARNLVAAMRSGGGADPVPLQQGSRTVPNPVFQELKLRFVDAESAVVSLQRQVNDATRELDRLEAVARANPMLEAEAQDMDRDYNVLRKNYEELLSRRESTKIAAEADTKGDEIKLQIVEPPVPPRVPVAPRRLVLLTGVLVAGLGAGLGLIFLLMHLDDSFFTVEDLRTLGLPVFGGISLIHPLGSGGRLAAGIPVVVGIVLLLAAFGGVVSRSWPASHV